MAQKRSIFEAVGSDARRTPAPKPGLIDRGTTGARSAIRVWLLVIFALVATMIVVGGLTRLTDSGLVATEVMPGIEPGRDIVDASMGRVALAPEARTMPESLLGRGPMGMAL